MERKKFYGTLRHVKLPIDDTDDSDLSDDGKRIEFGQVLADNSDDESDNISQNSNEDDIIISESELSSESKLPLTELKKRLPKTKKTSVLTTKAKLIWIKDNLMKAEDEIKFADNQDLPREILDLETPINFFRFLFSKNLIKLITDKTNLYVIQCRPNKAANVKKFEIEQFMGICLYTSVIQLPATRHY